MNNKVTIASAGSGKTTFLIEQALKDDNGNILITTYTQANEYEIRKKIILKHGFIPPNITIQTRFSFLLQHGVKPYQGCLTDVNIKGLILANGQSAPFTPESNFNNYYFSKESKIYSDKISKFVIRCNEKTAGKVIDRLSRIYSHIYIDEVQDLAGYDLDIVKLLFLSPISTLLVGDPRQGTYTTNKSSRLRQYRTSNILKFFEENKNIVNLDYDSLTFNYRCNKDICNLSDKLYPEYKATCSGNNYKTGHDGVFIINSKYVKDYLHKYSPIQLRDSIKTKVNDEYESINFGTSKGLTYDRVIIYPTKPIIKWLCDSNFELAPISCSKFYVALTRAKYSVGIIYDKEIEGLTMYEPESTKSVIKISLAELS